MLFFGQLTSDFYRFFPPRPVFHVPPPLRECCEIIDLHSYFLETALGYPSVFTEKSKKISPCCTLNTLPPHLLFPRTNSILFSLFFWPFKRFNCTTVLLYTTDTLPIENNSYCYTGVSRRMRQWRLGMGEGRRTEADGKARSGSRRPLPSPLSLLLHRPMIRPDLQETTYWQNMTSHLHSRRREKHLSKSPHAQ